MLHEASTLRLPSHLTATHVCFQRHKWGEQCIETWPKGAVPLLQWAFCSVEMKEKVIKIYFYLKNNEDCKHPYLISTDVITTCCIISCRVTAIKPMLIYLFLIEHSPWLVSIYWGKIWQLVTGDTKKTLRRIHQLFIDMLKHCLLYTIKTPFPLSLKKELLIWWNRVF